MKIRQGMDNHGVLLKLDMDECSIEQYSQPTVNNKENKSFLFKGVILYTWMDADSSEFIDIRWFCTASHLKDPAMAGGGALTYFERYFMLKQFQIPTSKDDPEFFNKKTKKKELINDLQYENLTDIIKEVGADEYKLLSWAKVDNLKDIKEDQYPQIIRMLESKKKE